MYTFVCKSCCHLNISIFLASFVVGNYIPIDKVRADIASAYVKEVECKARTMLLFYKNMCDEKV